MSRMRKKLMGPVAYYLLVTKTNVRSGDMTESKFGPFSNKKQTEMLKLEQTEARGKAGFEYEYRIVSGSTMLGLPR